MATPLNLFLPTVLVAGVGLLFFGTVGFYAGMVVGLGVGLVYDSQRRTDERVDELEREVRQLRSAADEDGEQE